MKDRRLKQVLSREAYQRELGGHKEKVKEGEYEGCIFFLNHVGKQNNETC
jgi:hypothetical protein